MPPGADASSRDAKSHDPESASGDTIVERAAATQGTAGVSNITLDRYDHLLPGSARIARGRPENGEMNTEDSMNDISLLLIANKAGYGLAPPKWRATLAQIRCLQLGAAFADRRRLGRALGGPEDGEAHGGA